MSRSLIVSLTTTFFFHQEAELAQDEAQRMASLADSEAQRCLALEREMEERKEESCGSGEVVAMTTAADRDR